MMCAINGAEADTWCEIFCVGARLQRMFVMKEVFISSCALSYLSSYLCVSLEISSQWQGLSHSLQCLYPILDTRDSSWLSDFDPPSPSDTWEGIEDGPSAL